MPAATRPASSGVPRSVVPSARLGLIRIWVRVVIDLFSDHTASGGGRFGWTVFLILLPWLAVFVSLQARGRGSNESAPTAAAQQWGTTELHQGRRGPVQDAGRSDRRRQGLLPVYTTRLAPCHKIQRTRTTSSMPVR